MYKLIILIFSILVLTQCKSKGDEDAQKEGLEKDWKLIEIYPDEVKELNEGGYYPLQYHNDKPSDDEFLENTDESVVALAVSDTDIVNTSKAYMWVNDSKQTLTLTEYEHQGRDSYQKVYSNNIFKVSLDMKFHERIDGLDDADMYVYVGTMTVLRKDLNETHTFRVIGGI